MNPNPKLLLFPLLCLKESKSKVEWKLAGPGEQEIFFSFLVQFMLTYNFSISGLVKRASAFGDGSAEGFSSICLFLCLFFPGDIHLGVLFMRR